MQITDLAVEEKLPPLLRLGFRPFFLAGAIFSIVALVLWIAILSGAILFQPYGGGLWWHIHEMLFGFGCAIVAGFLLTAVQNWTGMRGVSGKPLLGLFLLWLLGRVVLLLPMVLNQYVIMLIDLSFLPVVAYILAKPIMAIKQYRNLFFVPLLGLFTLANAEMHFAKLGLAGFAIKESGYAAVMLMTVLMSVMAGRVVPMFTANGTKTTKVIPLPWLEKAATISLAAITFGLLITPVVTLPNTAYGVLFIFAAACQLIRLLRLKPWITLTVPLLWSIHFSLIFICFGLLSIGVSYLVPAMGASHVWHLLTVGGMGGLILAMISRVSLGHTGRMLTPPTSMSLAFASIFVATIVRVFGPQVMPQAYFTVLIVSIAFWLLAFGLFVLHYAPMLSKPRTDGRPG